MRERDVRLDVAESLRATGEFHVVALGERSAGDFATASDLSFALIEPMDSRTDELSDAAAWGATLVKARCSITVGRRLHDPVLRDDDAERLLNVTRRALNGRSLAGVTLPDFTKVESWSWRPQADSERRVVCVLSFTYLDEGWNVADVSD